jgi:outer membrane protein OmpA-like peptidoglycan-associated protein/tetratricopeptide (TPR) repeat protein
MRKIYFSIIALLLFFALQAQEPNYNKTLKKAREFSELDEYHNALNFYLDAWKLKSTDPQVAYEIALIYMRLNNEAKTYPYLLVAQQGGIKDEKMTLYFARTFHMQHKFSDAITNYEKYLKENTKHTLETIHQVNTWIKNCNVGIELIKTPEKVTISNLGPQINTSFPDYAPVISADESVLIYTSRRDNTTGGERDTDGEFFEDIYESVKTYNKWEQSKQLSNLINTDTHDACVALSPDGMELIMYRVSPSDGGDLFISNLKNNDWVSPKRLAKTINTNYWEPSASITSDEKTLFFTSNKKGGFGGTDIYMSKLLANGEFGPAINLGPEINTPEDDDAPFIHPDSKTLYFSSKGHDGIGGFDIFVCTIDVETAKLTSKPKNIGYPINTAGDDIYFTWSADGKRAYFASERDGGFGDKDIYMLEREEVKVALTLIKGQIVTCDTKSPVASTIQVTDLATQKIVGVYNSNPITGKYTVLLPAGKNYAIAVDAPGYLFYSKNIDIPNQEDYIELVDSVCMNPIQVGKAIILRNVFFDVNKYTLRPESVNELDKLVTILVENPTIKIQISGHTDSDSDDQSNLILSDNRAKAVVDYLIGKGIQQDRLTWKGYGEGTPIVPNDTPENKQLNRRTEFMIISQ